MNRTRLFKTQAELEALINKKHPIKPGEDRFTDKSLALMVELGELAQNWRGFKYWSNYRNPRTTLNCEVCGGTGGHYTTFDDAKSKKNKVPCNYCDGTGAQEGINPLLEEFADCLHFIISIGLDLKVKPEELFTPSDAGKVTSETFLSIKNDVLTLDLKRSKDQYIATFTHIIELGIGLGFTLDEIEQAYYSKNKINHARQRNNY